MAATVPKLSKQAIERLEQVAKAHKLTPSQALLEFLPDPDAEFEAMLDSPNPKGQKLSRQAVVDAIHEVRKKRA